MKVNMRRARQRMGVTALAGSVQRFATPSCILYRVASYISIIHQNCQLDILGINLLALLVRIFFLSNLISLKLHDL